MLCADATSAEAVARLLGERKPRLMVTDPPYGIELDSEWRDRAGLNGCGPVARLPPVDYTGCRTIADRILRSRQACMEHERTRRDAQ